MNSMGLVDGMQALNRADGMKIMQEIDFGAL